MSNETSTLNNIARDRSLQDLSERDATPTHAPRNIASEAGQFRGFGFDRPGRSAARIAKAQAFHDALKALRADKSHCPRCGKARGEQFRTCDKCRAKVRNAKLRSRGHAVLKSGAYSLSDMASIVVQLRREMDKLQHRFRLWQKAVNYRRNLHYRTNRLRRRYYRPVEADVASGFLAGNNHAYDPTDT